jgi:outer membrane protein OmpA-like peptidoglycan-associated protein
MASDKSTVIAIAASAISVGVISFVLMSELDVPATQDVSPLPAPVTTQVDAESGDGGDDANAQVVVTPERERVATLTATLDDGVFHLSGVVPDTETAEELVAAALVAYGPGATTDIDVAPEVDAPPWLVGASQGLTLLPMITEGTIRAEGVHVEVTGSSPNQQYLDTFLAAVAAAYGVPEVTSNVEVTNLAPPSFNARFKNGVLILSGRLPNDTILQHIAGGAAAVYGADNVDNRLTTGERLYTSYWMYTMPGVFELLSRFPDYEIDVTNGITTGSLNDGANFASGSAELDDATRSLLDVAIAILTRDRSLAMRVEGHTDSVGSDALNQRLSEERAASAVAYLVAAGIDPGRITSVGYGETRPIASNATASGRASNRRVAFAFEQTIGG